MERPRLAGGGACGAYADTAVGDCDADDTWLDGGGQRPDGCADA